MSATRVVPVLSLHHNSLGVLPSSAEKNRVPLTFVRYRGEELPAPRLMSATRVVAVPLLFHNSTPLLPSLATKNRVPLTFVKKSGSELPVGLMSATWAVLVLS